jgi:hypothetical protein
LKKDEKWSVRRGKKYISITINGNESQRKENAQEKL